MSRRLRREVVLLAIFLVTLAIGRAFELLLSQEALRAATEYQRQLITDLYAFTPVTFLHHVWQSVVTLVATLVADRLPDFTHPQSVAELVGHVIRFLALLPLVVAGTVFGVIASIWQSETILASILVTLTFIVAIPIGLGLVIDRAEQLGRVWGSLLAAGSIYLSATLACTVLWAITWLGLALFGWVTAFAGYCTLGSGVLAGAFAFGVRYVDFRAARSADSAISRVTGIEHELAKGPPEEP